MEDISISNAKGERKVDIIFAFPGMGKTPYALNHKGVVDADFGYFRNSFRLDKANENKLFKPYLRMINYWIKDGFLVLSNQPDIMRFVDPKRAVCILPLNLFYSAKKMNQPMSVIYDWVRDWYNTASSCGIHVVMTVKGLDKLLGN